MVSHHSARRGSPGPGQTRMVDTPGGIITYTLVRKRVKNLNLRMGAGGALSLSIPYGCPDSRADQMVREKWAWITAARARQAEAPELPPLPSREKCREMLEEALARVYPLTAPRGVARC